jgi:hypothetical protein
MNIIVFDKFKKLYIIKKRYENSKKNNTKWLLIYVIKNKQIDI